MTLPVTTTAERQRAAAHWLASAASAPALAHTDWQKKGLALVPAGTARAWNLADVPCLGSGRTVTVPKPGLTRDDGAPAFWILPMDSLGVLCSPSLVAHLILAGRRRGATRG
ncbi:hypothetical protein [Kitasatospora sp. NPDC089509]|uniref:hypothetical protein n=1 Tax=Kitasatospora sp. NPDC089509 TaxID=3364079 RepID=UPI00382D899D